jgi:CheY-like chemotaxis protein
MAEILVVEDDAPLRSRMREALAGAGHQVEEAPGGNRALERLEAKRFDLLLTDLMMEEGTGFEVLEWVREKAPGLPVLVCSSYAKPENLKGLLTTQLYRVLRKPVPMAALVDHVRELLARS